MDGEEVAIERVEAEEFYAPLTLEGIIEEQRTEDLC